MGGGYIIDLQAFVVVVSARSSSDLADYKFFCFNGSPLYCQLITDRSNSEKIDWYDMDWNLIEGLQGLTRGIPNSGKVSPKPKNFNKMKEAVYKLSESIDSPFVRIDFYDIKGKPYFGEITFYPASGFGGFRPIEWNQRIGDCLDISKLKAK